MLTSCVPVPVQHYTHKKIYLKKSKICIIDLPQPIALVGIIILSYLGLLRPFPTLVDVWLQL